MRKGRLQYSSHLRAKQLWPNWHHWVIGFPKFGRPGRRLCRDFSCSVILHKVVFTITIYIVALVYEMTTNQVLTGRLVLLLQMAAQAGEWDHYAMEAWTCNFCWAKRLWGWEQGGVVAEKQRVPERLGTFLPPLSSLLEILLTCARKSGSCALEACTKVLSFLTHSQRCVWTNSNSLYTRWSWEL